FRSGLPWIPLCSRFRPDASDFFNSLLDRQSCRAFLRLLLAAILGAARSVCSTGQALPGQGKPDDQAFRLPFPRDVSPKLACYSGANKKIAEPLFANRWSDRRTSVLGPGDDDVSSSVRAMDFDLPGSRGK